MAGNGNENLPESDGFVELFSVCSSSRSIAEFGKDVNICV
jgi:hypothetical protein